MTTTTKKSVYRSPSGVEVEIAPESEHLVSIDEMLKRRDAWYEKNKSLLEGYSVSEYLREKRKGIESGLE